MPNADPTPVSPAARPLSLGVIFLTLYIDLIGFSIGFPLGPDLLDYYLKLEGRTGLLGWLVAQTDMVARACDIGNYAPVLFGGVIASVFSILQFVFAPFWGALSDRRGRRGVLMFFGGWNRVELPYLGLQRFLLDVFVVAGGQRRLQRQPLRRDGGGG